MGKVEKIMEKIIGDEQEIKNLLSKESIDDLYEFFLEKDNTLTMEEFDNEVYDILENYSKPSNNKNPSNNKIDQNTLEQISGGKAGFLKRTVATSLSALAISPVMNYSASAAWNHSVTNISRSVVESTKNKIKGGFVKLNKWISDHDKAVKTTAVAVTVATVGAIILYVAISKPKNTGNNGSSSSSQQGATSDTANNVGDGDGALAIDGLSAGSDGTQSGTSGENNSDPLTVSQFKSDVSILGDSNTGGSSV